MLTFGVVPKMPAHFQTDQERMPDLSDWRPEYSVGHLTLDTQHQRLLALCKRVSAYEFRRDKQSLEEFHNILNDLAAYASMHFQTEEAVLKAVDYPALAAQKQEHDAYSESLVEFMFDAIHGEPDKLRLQRYLETWWIDHILVSDMAYKTYLLARS